MIRVLHSLSFVDDPTRILRAIRFEQRFGFEIEERTLALITEAKDLLDKVSGDRIRHELDLILEEPKAPEMLERINALKLLQPLFANLKWNSYKGKTLRRFYQEGLPPEWFSHDSHQNVQAQIYGAYIILTAQSDQIEILKVLRRLRLKNHLAQMIIQANSLWHQLDFLINIPASQVAKKLEEFSQLEIYCVYFLCTDNRIRKPLESFALKWRWMKPETNGVALKKRGLKPGPTFSRILSELRAAWIDGQIKSKKEELAYLETLIKQIDQDSTI